MFDERPNVVVIVADTFRRDHLGAYGNGRIRAPHLDEFARSSVVFDNHLLSSFPTMPARADILTGTFSYTHMGWEPLPRAPPAPAGPAAPAVLPGPFSSPPLGWEPLPRHLLPLPEVLSKAGYHTMGIV